MRVHRRSELLVSLIVAGGCSASPGRGGSGAGQGAAESGASGMTSASGGFGASGASSGGAEAAVSNTGATGETSGVSVGAESSGAGSGTAPAEDAGSGATMGTSDAGSSQTGNDGSVGTAGPFTCNLILGLFTTSQWFNGTNPGGASQPFLKDGVDATRWEGKMQKYAYVEKWADPTDAVWDIPMANACATNANAPDRILFVGFSPGIAADQNFQQYGAEGKSQAGWETLLNDVRATIRIKYPSPKEIDILTMGRAPGNVLCSNNSDTDTIIPTYEDAAYQAVSDASNGFIKVGPKYYVPDCANSYIFANDSDYTTSAADSIAMQVAAYYVAHP